MPTNRDDVKETPDEQILLLLKNKATYETGFRTLIMKYQERLYHHIRRMVTGHDDADDVLQNTFVKVHKGIEGFREQSGLFTWLYRIATNESLTFLQKRKRKQTISIDTADVTLYERIAGDVFFDGDEAQAKLISALHHLPDKQRAVFNMRYYDDMSYDEISVVTGTSVGALKASYHHAAKKIEAFFKADIFNT
jgi:RNA polymerase sigma-70 factor (ECF subfamily)